MNEHLAKRNEIEHAFTYHPPKGSQLERYERLRQEGKELALTMLALVPDSPEREQAFMLLNLAIMSANAAIARHE